MIHRSSLTSLVTISSHSEVGVSTQPGCQWSRSRCTTGSPVRRPSSVANVVFPAPPGPTIATRSTLVD